MWLFNRRKKAVEDTEREIQALRAEGFSKVDEANRKTDKATNKVEEFLSTHDTAYLIFLATGGERRSNGKH